MIHHRSKMNIFFILETVLLVIFYLINPIHVRSDLEHPTNQMQNLQRVLSSLLTKTISDTQFQDPNTKLKIESELIELKKLAHHLNTNNKNSDPILNFLPDHFEKQASEALVAYQEGSRIYARTLIRSITGFCIACHTSDSSGPQLPKSSLLSALPLKPLELAQFYTATRQFDQAETIYSKIIQNTRENRDDLDEAVRQSLGIAIRVKNDPKLALALVEYVLKSAYSPIFLKLNASKWRFDILKWKSKKEIFNTPDEMLIMAKNLVENAQKKQKHFMDRSADIQYLRASSILHELMKKPLSPKFLSEAFFLEGSCYDALNPYYFDNLNNLYFAACIRSKPHSDLSEKCYHRYEQNIYNGYTNSSGTHLPQSVRENLIDLWALAIKPRI